MNTSLEKEFNSVESIITDPVVPTPQKYRIVERQAQAKILEETKGLSQRQLAIKNGIPRTTISV